MFDKQTYWQNRKQKQPRRGQGEKSKGKFYPKGEKALTRKVVFKDGEETKEEYPNALGGHVVRVGKGFNTVNRVEARRDQNSKVRMASHKNYAYQYEKNGFRHMVNKPEVKPAYPPSLTNHLRHRQRQIERAT